MKNSIAKILGKKDLRKVSTFFVVLALLLGIPVVSFAAEIQDLRYFAEITLPSFNEPGIQLPPQQQAQGPGGGDPGNDTGASGSGNSGAMFSGPQAAGQALAQTNTALGAIANLALNGTMTGTQGLALAVGVVGLAASIASLGLVSLAAAAVGLAISIFGGRASGSDVPDDGITVDAPAPANVDTEDGVTAGGAGSVGSTAGAPAGTPGGEEGAGGDTAGGGGCFTADTLVMVKFGETSEYKKFGELSQGDIIVGVVFDNGLPRIVNSRILEVLVHEEKSYSFMELETKTGLKLIGTSNHPIIVNSDNHSIQLRKLVGEENVLSAKSTVRWDTIAGLRVLPNKTTKVFNLETETENYFVSADGKGAVLVHNGGGAK